jgi:hypothetical protein
MKKTKFEEFLRKEEVARQADEKQKCIEAFKIQTETFSKEWELKLKELDAFCEKKIADYEEIALGRRKALELSIQRTPIKKVVRKYPLVPSL